MTVTNAPGPSPALMVPPSSPGPRWKSATTGDEDTTHSLLFESGPFAVHPVPPLIVTLELDSWTSRCVPSVMCATTLFCSAAVMLVTVTVLPSVLTSVLAEAEAGSSSIPATSSASRLDRPERDRGILAPPMTSPTAARKDEHRTGRSPSSERE